MTDILKNLQECSFRELAFPIVHIKEDGTQDLAVHKKADRNGALVEGTGLNPFQYSLTAVLVNGLARGEKETWEDLFPRIFLKLRDAFRDRSTGILNHPLYGQIKVKPQSWSYDLTSETRNGVFVDLNFVESDENADDLPSFSAVSIAKQAARDLDAQLGQLNPPPASFFPDGDFNSLSDFVDSITSIVDQAQLLQMQTLGKIKSVSAKLSKIADRVDVASRVLATDPITQLQRDVGPLNNGIVQILQSSRALNLALVEIGKTALSVNLGTQVYTVVSDTTIVGIAVTLKNQVKELIDLNPTLAGRLFIKKDEKIRYYEKL